MPIPAPGCSTNNNGCTTRLELDPMKFDHNHSAVPCKLCYSRNAAPPRGLPGSLSK
ncbi:hypothetical protein CY34DRAFT_801675 [Suillus luteus UH-Slu-Lm8-n1]|uniref:Uncharacterized protein n=1 Tax=Suillus luteus UH-Slu-Lm8-n1 TaxID=930992 RepID=A0A0D0A5C6_9AGAM|nr:hypothetical protein CY34DRAFT_801675 [Suillus luteus UH-Slu-Lm8-n1]